MEGVAEKRGAAVAGSSGSDLLRTWMDGQPPRAGGAADGSGAGAAPNILQLLTAASYCHVEFMQGGDVVAVCLF